MPRRKTKVLNTLDDLLEKSSSTIYTNIHFDHPERSTYIAVRTYSEVEKGFVEYREALKIRRQMSARRLAQMASNRKEKLKKKMRSMGYCVGNMPQESSLRFFHAMEFEPDTKIYWQKP
jgi:hypothetical protein